MKDQGSTDRSVRIGPRLSYFLDLVWTDRFWSVDPWEGFRSILQFCIATTMIIKLAPPELLFVSVGGIVTIMGVSRLDPGFPGLLAVLAGRPWTDSNFNGYFRVCGSYIKKYTSEQQHWTAESARHAQERISAVRTVRAFGHDRLENQKYSTLVRKVQEMTEKEARAQSQSRKIPGVL